MAETDVVAFRAQNTPEDIRELTRVANRLWNAKELRFWFYLVLGLWVVLVLAVLPVTTPWIFGEDESLASILFPFVVGFATLFPAYRWYARVAARSAIDPRGALARGYDVKAGPDGLHMHNENFETFYRWPAILLVRETDAHIFLFIDRRMALVVAKRFFASDDAFKEFVTVVRKYADPAAF